MINIRVIFVALAVATVCNAAWLAELPCDPSTNTTQFKGRVLSGNCIPQTDGSYLKYSCGAGAKTAVKYSCKDSLCTQCYQVTTYQTNNGVCNADDFMYLCFPKNVDYAKVAGTPGYLVQNKYLSGTCSGQPYEADVFSYGGCVTNSNNYIKIEACTSSDATVNVYSDPNCSFKTGAADVFLNVCYSNIQSICVMN